MDQSPAAAAQQLAFKKQTLISAVRSGETETVVDLLDGGVPISTKDDEGMSLLHWTALGGHVTTMRLLIRRGCDVDLVDGRGGTPLHVAAAVGQTKAVRELIRNGASKSVVAGNIGTPLHQAAGKGHVETALAMLEEGCSLDIVNSVGDTVLHAAAEGGNVEVVSELVGRGCDVNAVKANGCTPLHDAAGHGRTEAVCKLIKLGATKSVVAGNCGTPLHQAAFHGHVETVVSMLEEGCPLDVVDSVGHTVLHAAAQGGNVEAVRELVGRGCNMNAVKANGCTPLHSAAGCGRTEAVRELIKLGAMKSVVAGMYGTPLHQAIIDGHVETVKAMLEDGSCEPDLTSHNVTPSEVQVVDGGIIGICDSFDQTPVMCAVEYGQVEILKLLTSKGGSISDRDTHSLSAFEFCFVGGHGSKLSEFCEACGIGSSGAGLKGALATLITQGLVDARKVLCLCAVSGDNVFLEDQFIELVASDDCVLPGAIKFAKYYFDESVPFIGQLNIADENPLNPLQMALLSVKCFEMGFAIGSVHHDTTDHTSFIAKLLSHPVLKETVHENFPNGLSPLDLAQQFELHRFATLIEGAGGRPGVWADIPQDVFLSYRSELFTVSSLLKQVCDASQGSHEAVKKAVITFLGGQTVESAVHAADDSQLLKKQVLGQCPDLGDVVTHVLPRIQVRHWKRVGLALGMGKNSLDEHGQKFPNDDDRYLETLSYWLEHGSSVTWKTLLDVLGHFETKHTVDELTAKIVSVLGGGDKVSVQVLSGVLSGAGKCCSPVMCDCVCAASSSSQVVAVSEGVVCEGAVAAERSPPVCDGELCGVSSPSVSQ